MGSHPPSSHVVPAAADFGLVQLDSSSGLSAQLLPSGALYALSHGATLLNQLLPGPAENGLFRLLLRWRGAEGGGGWMPLAGVGLCFQVHSPQVASWRGSSPEGIAFTTTLHLHKRLSAWAWRVRFVNKSPEAMQCEAFHAQDLGLADEGAVRNNEAYISQYLDLLPVADPQLGTALCARQNQPMARNRHPWLAFACVQGAAAYCTDGYQFFGQDFRLTGEPLAMREPELSSRRLQYECALAGLQSRMLTLVPGAEGEITFVARFVEDHPAASGPADLALLRELLPATWADRATVNPATEIPAAPTASIFVSARWLHGNEPTPADLAAWFPGERRHEECDSEQRLLSFFHDADTHVVTRRKEALVARPHGHIVRSGTSRWIDDDQFGLTCYAAGIFGAQAYLGNPSFGRLLSVVRNSLNVSRASGQRVFVRRGGEWRQLGIPSIFAIQPGAVRWIYRVGDDLIVAKVWCSRDQSAAFLDVQVMAGPPIEFLVTHQLVLGETEFAHVGGAEIHRDAGWIGLQPNSQSLMGLHQPGACFAIATTETASGAILSGDGRLYADGGERGGPYVTILTGSVMRCGVILLGTHAGAAALPTAVTAARAEFAAGLPGAIPPTAPMRMSGGRDSGVTRIDEVLPWFTHNASIHFSAPHGLEQYGGAAWGVRDVCQGSVEWLLAAGEFGLVRRILEAVFAQQYAHDGSWPQWFMHPPFHFIQQAHSHGDVCFWPVKALCDYVEASNDFEFLTAELGYTDPENFGPAGPVESLWAHCDRVITQCEARFVSGTALVNYGDGDWDDTLQPADPAMRTRMVSAWTVGLAYHAFRQLAEVSHRAEAADRAGRLDTLLQRMRNDFAHHAMPGGVTAGFLIHEADNHFRPLLHPTDKITGIRYRLLPMTRSMLAELFTPEEAERHAALIEQELRFTDGVRLMSEPAAYHGGTEKLFKRAETAANVGREIGLQYVHAHLRYAEAMAKLGNADRLWWALQVSNPVAIDQLVPGSVPRQSNVYFSSSDADFADRVEATARWDELRVGKVPTRGGWRLYSSGPGLFLRMIRSCLLGLRESFGDVVFDPVLPRVLDGLTVDTHLRGRPVQLVYAVRSAAFAPRLIRVNGTPLPPTGREPNPYRTGGLRVAGASLTALLTGSENLIEIEL